MYPTQEVQLIQVCVDIFEKFLKQFHKHERIRNIEIAIHDM